jgi:hypothetical protein
MSCAEGAPELAAGVGFAAAAPVLLELVCPNAGTGNVTDVNIRQKASIHKGSLLAEQFIFPRKLAERVTARLLEVAQVSLPEALKTSLGVDPALADGVCHAIDRQHVSGDPIIHAMRF